jgi:hypothetical protein
MNLREGNARHRRDKDMNPEEYPKLWISTLVNVGLLHQKMTGRDSPHRPHRMRSMPKANAGQRCGQCERKSPSSISAAKNERRKTVARDCELYRRDDVGSRGPIRCGTETDLRLQAAPNERISS